MQASTAWTSATSDEAWCAVYQESRVSAPSTAPVTGQQQQPKDERLGFLAIQPDTTRCELDSAGRGFRLQQTAEALSLLGDSTMAGGEEMEQVARSEDLQLQLRAQSRPSASARRQSLAAVAEAQTGEKKKTAAADGEEKKGDA
ncbi:hypothetical protein TgHK011_008070 [Trichoderma gracile]|nr:hypothetical protein TgHK011_008070 [Trichoderma gracile]